MDAFVHSVCSTIFWCMCRSVINVKIFWIMEIFDKARCNIIPLGGRSIFRTMTAPELEKNCWQLGRNRRPRSAPHGSFSFAMSNAGGVDLQKALPSDLGALSWHSRAKRASGGHRRYPVHPRHPLIFIITGWGALPSELFWSSARLGILGANGKSA